MQILVGKMTEIEPKPEQKIEPKPAEKVIQQVIEDEMKKSYLAYSMSVIVGRALPDVKDGLKPVHRRILYAMNQMGMFHNRATKKSARIVGEVLGKFHPHGDLAVYDSLVRMVQTFSLRYPLIKGQGNFGCFTADTKVKLTDGRSLSFKELIKEHKQGKKNYCYTIKKDGSVGIELIKNPRVTKNNAKVIKLILNNNEEIICTPDHKFMLGDKSYKRADSLTKTDVLMSLSKKTLRVEEIIELNEEMDVCDIEVEDTHNFALDAGIFVHNSVDGDSAAASRYTEAKLNKVSEEMLQDIDKRTVKFVPNYDGSLKEPVFLPSKFPNLLVNGSAGIAVGMATNIPPHNLNEVADATVYLIDHPDSGVDELMQFVRGPDFPTAGIISGKGGIRQAYSTGRGKIIVKAKHHIEQGKERKRIIFTEIPYMVNKSQLIEEIAALVNDKKILGISDLRDESDRKGMRIVVVLKKEANDNVVLNQLMSHTRLKTTFGIINLALVENQPKVLNLKEIIHCYITHRRHVVRNRTEFDLEKAEEKAHILEGLLIALKDIDATIRMIKESDSAETAKIVLIARLSITEKQALAILDMKLQRLTGLEQEKIKIEHKELLELVIKLKEILADENRILGIIKDELNELKKNYGDERRTQIVDGEDEEIEDEDMIKPEEVVINITHTGYIKRIPIETYTAQRRGGKGVIAATTKEEDFVEDLFVANTHNFVLFFTNKGVVKWLKVHQIPEAGRIAKGSAIVNLLNLEEGEKITAYIPVKSFDSGYLFMATKKGIVKKTPISEFSRPRQGGIIAQSLLDGDELIGVSLTDGKQNIILATNNGMAVKFNEEDVRSMGRTAQGVRGIRLKDSNEVVGMVVAIKEDDTLFTITENGFGKRTLISEYRLIGRGGSGVKNIICSERNGKVVSIKDVNDDSDLMLISKKGIGIRINARDLSVIGRATQGVRIMRLEEGDKVAGVAKIVKE